MRCGPRCSGSAGRGYCAILAGCRRAKKSPPCAKGGQHGNAMQGGLRSRGNDSAGFLLSGAGAPLGCSVTLPSLSLPKQTQPAKAKTGTGAASRCRRHPAKCRKGSPKGAFFWASVLLPSAAAQFGCSVTLPRKCFQNTACRWDPPPPLAAPSCKPAAPQADTGAPGCKGCWPKHRPAPK